MSLREQILSDMKDAMKKKEGPRLEVLRFLQAAIKNKEIEVRPNEISEQDILGVVTKQVKQRKESIAQFQEAGRQDLVDKESFELSVLETYLPKQMSREDLERIVSDVITATGANSIKQMGAVMKEVLAKTAGAADGKLVSEIVKSKLQ
ncbi:MAG: GatB/YqeY domain-containing protein [Bdellovibrionaceae bacterium]|nr:GatB/YqeY domain-containing protein [Pseudobdellovibrionaceae bacterium]